MNALVFYGITKLYPRGGERSAMLGARLKGPLPPHIFSQFQAVVERILTRVGAYFQIFSPETPLKPVGKPRPEMDSAPSKL